MKNVLSLCGGGTSGYITSKIIEYIEEDFGINLIDHIDLISGVSTGSIIGSLLNLGYCGKEISEIYKDNYDSVFGKVNYLKLLTGSLYDNNKLKSNLYNKLGNVTFDKLKIPFTCHALCLSIPKLNTTIWKSWLDENKNKEIVDPIVASCSSPFAFLPHKVGDKYYYDGGLVINDPSLLSYIEAKNMFNDDIRVFNFKTDYHVGYKNPLKIKGFIKLPMEFRKLVIDGGESATTQLAKGLIENYVDVNPKVYLSIDDDSWEKMEIVAKQTFKENREELIKIIKK